MEMIWHRPFVMLLLAMAGLIAVIAVIAWVLGL
jgi:hypothetical protein